MIASYLKPNSNSRNGNIRFSTRIEYPERRKNQNLARPLMASICLLICIVFVPERPTHLASICEQYNSDIACKVW